MLVLRPGNPFWKAYIWYERLGGNRHHPETESLARFLSIIFVRLPLRWAFSWRDTSSTGACPGYRIPPVAWGIIASWMLIDGIFGVKLAVLGVIMWFLAEIDTILSTKQPKKRGFEPNNDRFSVKIR